MKHHPTRRRFLQTAVAAGLGYFSCRSAAAAESANEKLNVGIIGVGGRGAGNMGQVSGEIQVLVAYVVVMVTASWMLFKFVWLE